MRRCGRGSLDLRYKAIRGTKPAQLQLHICSVSVGLVRVGALPDGKDFMTFTPRGSTVLTRAAYSDKVITTRSSCIISSLSSAETIIGVEQRSALHIMVNSGGSIV